MKGIRLNYKDNQLNICVEKELFTIRIDNVVDKCTFMHVGSVDYDTHKRNIWHEFTPIDLGDVFEIGLTDIQEADPPAKSMYDTNIKRPISKLEGFYKLESLLKEKGLL